MSNLGQPERDALIAEVRQALGNASPAPWHWAEWALNDVNGGGVVFHGADWPVSISDARLIALAPEWLARLVAALEDRERELQRVREDLRVARSNLGPSAYGKNEEDGTYNICLGYHPEEDVYEWLVVVPVAEVIAAREARDRAEAALAQERRRLAWYRKHGVHFTGSTWWPTLEQVDAAVAGEGDAHV